MIESGRAQTLPNLTIDPEDRSADDPLELCIPLMAEGSCVGLLKVAWLEDSTDQVVQGGLRVIADRLAVGLALNRAVRGKSYLVHAEPPRE